MSATCVLIFEYGIGTLSWYAWLALRTRVNMSAIGSVIMMWPHGLSRRGFAPPWSATVGTFGVVGVYQLLFVMPGNSPACAISRKQIRHRPNLRYTEWERPQRVHRV